jgi:hypothetical protein
MPYSTAKIAEDLLFETAFLRITGRGGMQGFQGEKGTFSFNLARLEHWLIVPSRLSAPMGDLRTSDAHLG